MKKKAKPSVAIQAYPHGTVISNCVILQLTDKQMKFVRILMDKVFRRKS